MAKFHRASFSGDPNIGLYAFATDEYMVTGWKDKTLRKLKVPVRSVSPLETEFAGLFLAGNSAGVVMSRTVEDHGMEAENAFVLDTKYTAVGNLILMNDHGIVLSPLLRRHRQELSGHFGIPCNVAKIAGTSVVGSAAVATNRGCLVNPKIKKTEANIIEDTLNVEWDVGTVNYGSPYPGAGIIANSKAILVSESTSGPEMGRIMEVLGE